MTTIIHAPTEAPDGGWLEGDQITVLYDGGHLTTLEAGCVEIDGALRWVERLGTKPLGVADRWLAEGQILVAVLVDRPKLPTAPGSVIRFENSVGQLVTAFRDDGYSKSRPWRDHMGVWYPVKNIPAWTLIFDAGAEK